MPTELIGFIVTGKTPDIAIVLEAAIIVIIGLAIQLLFGTEREVLNERC